LIRHLAGEISLAVASEKAKQDTRHYAKRQFTWFRHQLADWPHVAPETALEWLRSASSIGRMPAPSTALRAVPLPRFTGEDELIRQRVLGRIQHAPMKIDARRILPRETGEENHAQHGGGGSGISGLA
ncbi:MAG: hypothetical protein WB500_07385, partial [Rhodoplanes sp.]